MYVVKILLYLNLLPFVNNIRKEPINKLIKNIEFYCSIYFIFMFNDTKIGKKNNGKIHQLIYFIFYFI